MDPENIYLLKNHDNISRQDYFKWNIEIVKWGSYKDVIWDQQLIEESF